MRRFFASVPYLLGALIACAPFVWFGGHSILLGPDALWKLNYNSAFIDTLFLWKAQIGSGYGWADVNATPHNLLALSLLGVGLSYAMMQKVTIATAMFLSFVGMYWLLDEVTGETPGHLNVGALLGAAAYVLNPFALTWVWWRFLWVIYIYPVLPLIFLVLTRALRRPLTLRELIIVNLWLLLFAPGLGAIVMCFALLCAGVVYTSAYLATSTTTSRDVVGLLKSLSIWVIVFGLFNLWWLVPGVLMLSNSISNALTAYDPMAVFRYTSTNAQLINDLRLWGYRALYDSFLGEPYYGASIVSLGRDGVRQLLLYIPAVLALFVAATQWRIRSDRTPHVYALVALLVGGLFLI